MMDWTVAGVVIATVLFLLYHWSKPTYDFWTSRNVPGPKPLPWVGNMKDFFLNRLSAGEVENQIYKQHRHERLIGIYAMREPVLMLIDLDLIKDVLVQDFATFPDRGFTIFDRADPLTQHLVNLDVSRWRPLRHQFTPAFTSVKLKKMFYLILKCGDHLAEYLNNLGDDTASVECTDLSAKFLTDVVSLCFFGIQAKALADDGSTIRQFGRNYFDRGLKNTIKMRMRDYLPRLYAIFGSYFADREAYHYFSNILTETIKYRKDNNIVRNDFVDIIAELKNHPDKFADLELTDELLTAQMYLFFLAGFETTSITISNSLYELALNQGVQDKLRDEIATAIAGNNGQLTYELVKSMNYLDMVFKETLRIHPPATSLRRKSRKPYTFSGTKVTIPEGIRILVPIVAIHRDPTIYPEPEVFSPERFTDEAIRKRHPMSWLPFGSGPRNCIGIGLAHAQYKVGLIKILLNRKVEVCEKTQIPYIMDPKSDLLGALNGIHLKMTKIN